MSRAPASDGLSKRIPWPGASRCVYLQAPESGPSHDHPPHSQQTAPAAGAIVATDTAGPRGASPHGRSIRPPSRVSGGRQYVAEPLPWVSSGGRTGRGKLACGQPKGEER